MKRCNALLACCALLAELALSQAGETGKAVLVRGVVGQATGGFRQSLVSHRGEVTLSGVRKRKDTGQLQWKSEPMPATLPSQGVTLVWSGALGVTLGTPGIGASRLGDFTISVNGHEAVDFDVVMWPTEFPGRNDRCRLIFNVLYAPPVPVFTPHAPYATGMFSLTVPSHWLKPGEPASLQVRARDRGKDAWFGLIASDDAPLSPPTQVCKVFRRVEQTKRFAPPPAGQEASLEWYRKQFDDNSIMTAIGPPGDPADLAVSTDGQLQYALDRPLPGTPYVANALSFAIVENGRAIPFGWEPAACQRLWKDGLPFVATQWNRGDWAIEQISFGCPLRGTEYSSGLESTIGWAAFSIENKSNKPREITLLITRPGDHKKIVRDLTFRDGVVFEGDSARFAAELPEEFTQEFLPVFPRGEKIDAKDPLALLRRGGMYGVLVVRGVVEPGDRKIVAVNGVFDFPGMDHWKPEPVKVQPKELLRGNRKSEIDWGGMYSVWRDLAKQVQHFRTPDETLNRILVRGMLDGYELTKRWKDQYICIDSVCYRRQWDDTSMKWFYALDLMGDHKTAERLFDTVFARQGKRKPAGTHSHEGCFSDVTNTDRDGSDSAWASCNGWALWAMAEHARLANDRAWLLSHKKQIVDGFKWIARERAFSTQEPNNPCTGLLRGKFVCDMPDQWGPGGVGYFIYTDAINYMGIHEMGLLLKEHGQPEGDEMLREADAYRRNIVAAVNRLTNRSTDPWFVPWDLSSPKLDHAYLNGVCGPINLAYSGVLPRTDPLIDHVIRWNIDRTHGRSPERSATANMFYSQDLAITLLELGREEEFLRMFYTVLAANISPDTLTTFEWWNNTQPHLHSVASMIRMTRTMLIQERDGALVLLQGAPRRWFEQGKEIDIRQAPTRYGPLSLMTHSDIERNEVRIDVERPERLGSTPMRLKLRLPGGKKIAGVVVNGRNHNGVDGEWIIHKDVPERLAIIVRTAATSP
jgi:hypothetical protein